MSFFIPIALFGFPFFASLIYLMLPPTRAFLTSYLVGWLLLPQAGYDLPGIPDYDRSSCLALTCLALGFLFHLPILTAARFRWYDLPMLVVCCWPLGTAITNGINVFTGLDWCFVHAFRWGIPYCLGRAYIRDPLDLRELCCAIVVAGLACAPLCWLEVRLSPFTHRFLYGFFQASYLQHMRYGGFRPALFLQHGIMVAVWMAMCTIMTYWVWRNKLQDQFFRVSTGIHLVLMTITVILCKTASGLAALLVGIGLLEFTRRVQTALPLFLLSLAPLTYIGLRVSRVMDSESLPALIQPLDPVRAGSLRIRMKQEDVFVANAMRAFVFGFGTSEFMPKDESGKPLTRGVDGFWIIQFGLYGMGSTIAVFLALGQPLCRLSLSHMDLRTPENCMLLVMALIPSLFAVDLLFNGMVVPIYVILCGAVTSPSMFSSDSDSDETLLYFS